MVFGVKEACVTSSTLLVNTVIFLAVLSLCQISWVYNVHKCIYIVYTYTCIYMHKVRYTHIHTHSLSLSHTHTLLPHAHYYHDYWRTFCFWYDFWWMTWLSLLWLFQRVRRKNLECWAWPWYQVTTFSPSTWTSHRSHHPSSRQTSFVSFLVFAPMGETSLWPSWWL